MSRPIVQSQFLAVSVVALLLSACGGGGGGGDSPPPVSNPPPGTPPPPTNPGAPTYTGSTQPVPLNQARTPHVVAAVIAELGFTNVNARPYPTKRDTGETARPRAIEVASGSRRFLSLVEEPCTGGGTVDVTDNRNANGMGTVVLIFSNCVEEGVTTNGTLRLRVDAIEFRGLDPVPTDSTLTFERLLSSVGTASILLHGTSRLQLAGNTETLTHNVFGEYQPENVQVRLVNVRLVTAPNDQSPFGLTTTAVGQLFHSNHGFVDISTVQPIIIASFDDAVPSAGLLRITGAQASTATISFADGFHTVSLDSDGNAQPDATLTATWNALRDTQNFLPIARLGPDATGVEGVSVMLDASASSDWEGDPFTFEWSVATRPPGSTATIASNSATAVLTPDLPGTYDVRVTTRQDGNGNSDLMRLVVTPNADPVVSISVPFVTTVEQDAVQLSATVTDAENDPVTLQWEIVQRPMGSTQPAIVSTSATFDFIPDAPGQFVLRFSADDQRGIGSETVTVTSLKYLSVENIDATFEIRASSSLSETRGTLRLATSNIYDGPALSYTVQSSEPWLVVPPAGTAPDAGGLALIEVTLDVVQLGQLANGNHAATVAITPFGRSASFVPIQLDFLLPVVTNLTPHVAHAGVETSVNLFGAEMIQAHGRTLLVDGLSSPGFINRTTNTHATVPLPDLAVGEYQVSVHNELGIQREMSRLVVRDPPDAYTDAEITLPGRVESLEYDAERDQFYAVFAVSTPAPQFEARVIRRDAGGVWNSDQQIFVPALAQPLGLTLTADGRFLLVTASNCAVYRFDVQNQSLDNPVQDIPCLSGMTDPYEDIMAQGDGRVLLSNSTAAGNVVELPNFAPFGTLPAILNPAVVVSYDKSHMLWASSQPRQLHYYQVNHGSLAPFTLPQPGGDFPRSALTMSRSGAITMHRADVFQFISFRASLSGISDPNEVTPAVYGPFENRAVVLDEPTGNLLVYEIFAAPPFNPIAPAIPLAGEILRGSRVFVPPNDSAAFVFTTREADPNVHEMWVRTLPP